MRPQNTFTARQIIFIKAICKEIALINTPDPEIITHESYTWSVIQTRRFGKIPKIRFLPHSCQKKAEIMRQSGLIDPTRQREIEKLRNKYSIRELRHGHARLFESEWDNIMLKIKKAAFTIGFINNLFVGDGERIAEPIRLLQAIVLAEHASKLKSRISPENIQPSDKTNRYEDELNMLDD